MKTFRFKIEERATYIQRGHVTIIAVNEKIAKKLVLQGKYEHEGDNEIDFNTESKTKVLDAQCQGEVE